MGALIIASSGVLVRLAGTSPETAAFFRCAYALPALGFLAARRHAPGDAWHGATAGALFALDLILWHHAIAAVGAGLATVLANLQVVWVALLAWALLGERPGRRLTGAALLALAGVLLLSGLPEGGGYGRDPVAGAALGLLAALAYAGFLLVLRQGGADAPPVAVLARATAWAALASGTYGLATGTLDPVPRWPAHGWLALLALGPQVLGWSLIASALPRLPAAVASAALLLQPAAAVALGRALLDEAPSAVQWLGVVAVLAAVAILGSSRGEAPGGPAARPAASRAAGGVDGGRA